LFAPERLLSDILHSAGFKRTWLLFSGVKKTKLTSAVGNCVALPTVVDVRVLTHTGSSFCFLRQKQKAGGMPATDKVASIPPDSRLMI
jgi:hypothetical protein